MNAFQDFADPGSTATPPHSGVPALDWAHGFASLGNRFFTELQAQPLPAPYWVGRSASMARELGLSEAWFDSEQALHGLIGNSFLPGTRPLASVYSGHQFGFWAGQLGDGRALLLGDLPNRQGQRLEVQLKGAGITPYSRSADGRAVLRSSIREYLCSEAMHALGIPTSRALCIVGSDEEVYRETIETAAVLTRLAPSHVRFGSFEVFFHRGQHQQIAALADYVIARHFPNLTDDPEKATDKYRLFLNEVTQRTARLMAQWQAVGFSHGVMNTDNMSILGLTFDYGPFGFMESYDPGYICNHSAPRRPHAYDRQPSVRLWNLACLAQALSPLIHTAAAHAVLDGYAPAYHQHHVALMGAKLGLSNA